MGIHEKLQQPAPVLTAAIGEERGFAFTQLPNARAEAATAQGVV